jgi:signal transduction histidine kinase
LGLEDEEGQPLAGMEDHPLVAALAGRSRVEHTTAALRRPDGELRWLRCSAAPVLSDGTRTGVVLVAVDLTREKEVEQLRSDFIATVSHELRTPLTPLSGFLGVLREHGGALDDDRRTMMISAMEKQVGRLSDLISDLLQVAEFERGLTHVRHETVDMAEVIDDLLDVVAAVPEDRQRIQLDVTASHAMADQAAVRRILRALISNGLKHTAGDVHVACQEHDGAVVVTVDDEGDGIAESARDAIFEPFRRLGNHLHRTQGPGLGLSVARSLAEALDGSLDVTEASTGGARFVLQLPAAGDAEGPGRTLHARHGA